MSTPRSPVLAAIDLGTNSFHIVVVEVDRRTGKFRILDREKEIVRLGSGSSDMKHLSAEAMDRAVSALRRFREIATSWKAQVRAVGTSAVREALNQGEFLRRIRRETGIVVETVSGVEEARLIYLGVLQALPVYDRRILLVDIGGGSTEFLLGRRGQVLYDNSLQLGVIRLTERFFSDEGVTRRSVKKFRRYVAGMLNPVVRAVRSRGGFRMAVGSSGSIENIAAMARAARGEPTGGTLNNVVFSRRELDAVVERILGADDLSDILKIPGLDPDRADIITAGALILEQVFEQLGIDRMTVSEFSLREGIVFDMLDAQGRMRTGEYFNTIRYRSVLHLAEGFRYEAAHARAVADIALRLFDDCRSLHRMGSVERELLEYAALLHDIGMCVSHDQHHRHSYYIIRNAGLLGFTEREKEIIANVARYHRKSHPKQKHDAFGRLDPDDQDRVRKLAAILRIADGLDRSHAHRVRDARCRITRSAVVCALRGRPGIRLDLEIWGAERKGDLFAKVFAKPMRFVPSG